MDFKFKTRIFILTFIVIFLLFHGCNREVDAWQTAPDFSLEDLSGNIVTLTEYRGNIILLDFWATWCPPCRVSIPELADLQRKYRDQGLVILGISLDNPQQINNNFLSEFKEKFKINYTILRVNKKVYHDYFGTGQVSIPTMFIINRKGKIIDKHVGFRPGAIERSLEKLL